MFFCLLLFLTSNQLSFLLGDLQHPSQDLFEQHLFLPLFGACAAPLSQRVRAPCPSHRTYCNCCLAP